MNLQTDLTRIKKELEQALEDRDRIDVRIAGLRAEQVAVEDAMARRSPSGVVESDDLTRLTKADAIVAVLRASAPNPLTIRGILDALAAGGRPNESYNGVSVYLQDLLARNRVQRLSRGLYTAT
jgi:hypothetical protein